MYDNSTNSQSIYLYIYKYYYNYAQYQKYNTISTSKQIHSSTLTCVSVLEINTN